MDFSVGAIFSRIFMFCMVALARQGGTENCVRWSSAQWTMQLNPEMLHIVNLEAKLDNGRLLFVAISFSTTPSV